MGIFMWTIGDAIGVAIAIMIAGWVIAMMFLATVDIHIIKPIKRWFQCGKKLFRIPDPIEEFKKGTGKRFNIGGGWGCRIEWFQDSQNVTGWQPVIPVVNDWLLAPMQSGKMGVFRFTEIERCRDPRDMFFGKVKFCGYADDQPPEKVKFK